MHIQTQKWIEQHCLWRFAILFGFALHCFDFLRNENSFENFIYHLVPPVGIIRANKMGFSWLDIHYHPTYAADWSHSQLPWSASGTAMTWRYGEPRVDSSHPQKKQLTGRGNGWLFHLKRMDWRMGSIWHTQSHELMVGNGHDGMQKAMSDECVYYVNRSGRLFINISLTYIYIYNILVSVLQNLSLSIQGAQKKWFPIQAYPHYRGKTWFNFRLLIAVVWKQ